MDAQSRGGPHFHEVHDRGEAGSPRSYGPHWKTATTVVGSAVAISRAALVKAHNDKVSEFEKQLTSPRKIALMFHREARAKLQTSETAPQSPRRGEYVQARLLTDSERGVVEEEEAPLPVPAMKPRLSMHEELLAATRGRIGQPRRRRDSSSSQLRSPRVAQSEPLGEDFDRNVHGLGVLRDRMVEYDEFVTLSSELEADNGSVLARSTRADCLV